MDDSDRKIITGKQINLFLLDTYLLHLDSVDDAVREVFIEYDKGKLGWISTDEFERMALKMTENLKGPKVTPEVVKKLINDFGGVDGRLPREIAYLI